MIGVDGRPPTEPRRYSVKMSRERTAWLLRDPGNRLLQVFEREQRIKALNTARTLARARANW